jgi:hypothetical protein
MATDQNKINLDNEILQEPEIQAAIDYGIDISMLIENLKLSCAERIRRHQIALNTIDKLRKAKIE